jgi:amino acid adenylation domain-containing protein
MPGIEDPDAIQRISPHALVPASSAQRRLWFLHGLLRRPEAYHVPALVRWNGMADPSVLHRCLAEIMDRHEPLRTAFHETGGQVYQDVLDAAKADVPMEVWDLRDLPESRLDADVTRLLREHAGRAFDLSVSPLWRAVLIQLADETSLMQLTMHHIVVDAWSVPVLFGEIAQVYAAFSQGRQSPLAPLPVRYADYAGWARTRLRGSRHADMVTYWRSVLSGAPGTIDLPRDRPRPPVFSHDGDAVEFRIPDDVAKQVASLARRLRASPFIVLLAAFTALLHRYTRQADLVIGTPVANRPHADLTGLVGFFTNMVVLRADVSGDPSFSEFVGRMRSVTLSAVEHEELPFEELVAEIDPERSLSYNPLFQVQFTLASVPSAWRVRPGLEIVWLPGTRTGTAKFDLSFVCYEESGTLRGGAEYATDLFDRSTIERMVRHFVALLDAATRQPQTPLSQFDLLSENERRLLTRASLGPAKPYPDGRVLSELIEARAAENPQALALEVADTRLTYAEFNARANRLARHLRTLGVGPDILVAICLKRSAALSESVLAVLKAGGAYVPIDPDHPPHRRALVLESAAPAVLITHSALLDEASSTVGQTVLVDRPPAELSTTSDGDLPVVARPDSLAYVTFTSGSTGQPKGVAVPQRTVVNLMHWHLAEFATGARTLQFAALTFDVSIYEMLAAWLGGSCLVLAGEAERHDVDALASLVVAKRIDKAMPPVSVLHHLAEVLDTTRAEVCLREVVTIGETLVITQPVRDLFDIVGARLHNQYGPSESGTVVTDYPLPGQPRDWPARPAIGRPIANTRLYLLDEDLRPVPIGLPGEIYIGGDCLARGYLGRPDLTADRFVPDPIGKTPGQRLYRTSDLARIGSDGEIHFISRMDDQLKVRGLRVELGEIEAVLGSCPGVRAAAVATRATANEGFQLVAYVVVNAGTTGDALRAYLKQRLPAQMVPAAVVLLDALPLNASGKVDRGRLPDPSGTHRYLAPETKTETALAEIWAEILDVEPIGRDDDFFAIGGHSLRATRIVTLARARFGVELTFAEVFLHPTVETLAAHIDALRASAAVAQAIPQAVPRSIPDEPVRTMADHGSDDD